MVKNPDKIFPVVTYVLSSKQWENNPYFAQIFLTGNKPSVSRKRLENFSFYILVP